jgi:putative polyhydroxyalkanoate system protein
MSTISIQRRHVLPHDQVRRSAEQLARRIEQRLAVQWSWEGDCLTLTAPPGPARGARGKVHVRERDVHIEIHLPFALRPVKSLVESKLHSKLDDILGPPTKLSRRARAHRFSFMYHRAHETSFVCGDTCLDVLRAADRVQLGR